jgi:hypothetical protein
LAIQSSQFTVDSSQRTSRSTAWRISFLKAERRTVNPEPRTPNCELTTDNRQLTTDN